jgi:hypothetical protein
MWEHVAVNMFARAVALVVLTMFLVAPVSASAACDDDHQSGEHATVCVCVCCTPTAFATDMSAALVSLPAKGRLWAVVTIMTGMLLPADIFRPPAAA